MRWLVVGAACFVFFVLIAGRANSQGSSTTYLPSIIEPLSNAPTPPIDLTGTPTATATVTQTATPTVTLTPTPTATFCPLCTLTPSGTPTAIVSPTPTATATPSCGAMNTVQPAPGSNLVIYLNTLDPSMTVTFWVLPPAGSHLTINIPSGAPSGADWLSDFTAPGIGYYQPSVVGYYTFTPANYGNVVGQVSWMICTGQWPPTVPIPTAMITAQRVLTR